MSTTSSSVSSLISGSTGIDTDSLITQLVQLEYDNKITPAQNKVSAYELQISSYSKIKSYVSDISTKVAAIKEADDFAVFKESSTDEDVATISGDIDCQTGDYSLRVYHAGTKQKIASDNGLVTSQTASLSSLGITTGTISIDDVELTIDDDDTIQDLRSKINSATDDDGDKLGVTASVIKLSNTNFRLVLSAKDTGNTGIAYKDVSGSTLTGLGIITNTDGDIGVTSQKITTDDDVTSSISALTSGDTFSFSGTDHDGNTITYSLKLTGTMSSDSLCSAIESAYHNTISASIDSDGKLTITDAMGGTSELSFSITSFGSQANPACTTTQGEQRANVLSAGSSAYFNVDGLDMVSESNDAEDFIPGATIHIKKSSPEDDETLSISEDTDAVAKKIQAVIDAYNTLYDYIKTETSYANSDEEDSTDGDLVGDTSTAKTILNTISSFFHTQFSNTGSFKTLSSIGITTDTSNGHLTVDGDNLKKALETNIEDVIKLFTTSGSSSNKSITYGKSGTDTKSGMYDLETTDDGTTFRIKLQGTTDWITSDARIGDIVKFSSGTANGLMLTIPTGTMSTGDTTTFNMSMGFGDKLTSLLSKMTDTYDGTITLHSESLTSMKTTANNRITTLAQQISDYQDRLTKQYSALQTTLSKMQSQYNNMVSALSSSSD